VKANEPIGCRDTATLDFFQRNGIQAFFSGCLTLLLKRPNKKRTTRRNIYLVDVKHEVESMLPSEIQHKGIRIQHDMVGDLMNDTLHRFQSAFRLIELYSEAKLVITQRIHCALPCVAMGIPVVFINSPLMPGGGGTNTKRSSRTVGLTDLFHTLDLYSMSTKNAIEWIRKVPLGKPSI
jgi:hypothetical protein